MTSYAMQHVSDTQSVTCTLFNIFNYNEYFDIPTGKGPFIKYGWGGGGAGGFSGGAAYFFASFEGGGRSVFRKKTEN